MKSKKLLDSFTKYCMDHPELRFWQALRNWCGWGFVYVSTNDPDNIDGYVEDTFYWENNETP